MRIKQEIFTGINRICWLCVFMEEFMGIKSLKNAPLILSGMNQVTFCNIKLIFDRPTILLSRV